MLAELMLFLNFELFPNIEMKVITKEKFISVRHSVDFENFFPAAN